MFSKLALAVATVYMVIFALLCLQTVSPRLELAQTHLHIKVIIWDIGIHRLTTREKGAKIKAKADGCLFE